MFRSFQKRGNASQPKGFFGSLIENIKDEFNKNKDIKVNKNIQLFIYNQYIYF